MFGKLLVRFEIISEFEMILKAIMDLLITQQKAVLVAIAHPWVAMWLKNVENLYKGIIKPSAIVFAWMNKKGMVAS